MPDLKIRINIHNIYNIHQWQNVNLKNFILVLPFELKIRASLGSIAKKPLLRKNNETS